MDHGTGDDYSTPNEEEVSPVPLIASPGAGPAFDAPLSDERVERLKILEELRRAQSSSSKVLAPSTTFPPNESEYNLLTNDLQCLQNHLLLAEKPDFSSDSENDENEVDEQTRAKLSEKSQIRSSLRMTKEEHVPREVLTGQASARRPYIVTPVPVSPSEVLDVAPSTIDEESDDEESRLYLERGMRFAMEHMQELMDDYDRRTGTGVKTHDDNKEAMRIEFNQALQSLMSAVKTALQQVVKSRDYRERGS
ncbi:unnamed protein product [Caenorhabditis brenneri]